MLYYRAKKLLEILKHSSSNYWSDKAELEAILYEKEMLDKEIELAIRLYEVKHSSEIFDWIEKKERCLERLEEFISKMEEEFDEYY